MKVQGPVQGFNHSSFPPLLYQNNNYITDAEVQRWDRTIWNTVFDSKRQGRPGENVKIRMTGSTLHFQNRPDWPTPLLPNKKFIVISVYSNLCDCVYNRFSKPFPVCHTFRHRCMDFLAKERRVQVKICIYYLSRGLLETSHRKKNETSLLAKLWTKKKKILNNRPSSR